jgi:hypothetical protein
MVYVADDSEYIITVEKLISLELSRGEKELLLNMPDLDAEVSRKLQVIAVHGNSFVVKFAIDKLRSIVEGAEKGAEQAEDENLQKAYREFHLKLDRIVKANP